MSESNSSVEIVKCERHGLRYNAAIQSGCARCRKEGDSASAKTDGPAAASGSAGPTLLLTAALLVATSSGLFMLHSGATESFQNAFVFGGPSFFEDTGEEDYDPDMYGDGDPMIDFCDQVDDPDAMLTREERRQYREMCNDPIFRDP